MRLRLKPATAAEAPAVAALRTATAAGLTARFGQGPWSSVTTERGVLFDLRNSSVFVAKLDGQPVVTLRLAAKKPWAIDRAYFTPVARPIYLTAMAVAPELQRRGLGRQCLEQAREIARAWPAQALCLDAFDATAGAGEFYRKCGFREMGRRDYRGVPLVYFETLL
jgi:GNAT superfamily N-acetyltransferase